MSARYLQAAFLVALLMGNTSLGQPLKLEKDGTQQVYFSYHGAPLLSFGGLSDFIFYAGEDAYDYKLWADWAAAHGINHVRAYPPLSWKHIEKFIVENGGSLENVLFPYRETQPGSRQFDLRQFDEKYWKRFREKCRYLQTRGIIVHLLMWNGWQLRAADTRGRDRSSVDWDGHFFNPANNVNAFTDHLGGELSNRFQIYHSAADRHTALAEAQKAWFRKLIDETADLENVYYDLVHELAEHQGDWAKTQAWIDAMVEAIRERWAELRPDRQLIIGMDTGGLRPEQRDWIFSRPYFNILIYGKKHTVEQAREWRIHYKKPYIPQESWDDNGVKYSYIHPEQRAHARKYMWKFMMAKCQQLDLYMKPRRGFPTEGLPMYPHNYDPRGRNRFEDDALVLRRFWDSLVDYGNLWFEGTIESGPGQYQYILSSPREVVLYFSSATGKENVRYGPQTVRLADLPLAPGAGYRLEIVDPKAGGGVIETRDISVAGPRLEIELPGFVDDIAVHIYSAQTGTAATLPPIRAITHGPKFHWFGYYDKLQFDPSGRYALGMEVDFENRSPTPGDTITIGMVDLQEDDRWIELGRSSAWCWQQGCMLQWRPGSNSEILWNDREGDRYICRILDVSTRLQRTIPYPIYTVSPDGNSALTTDFRRIQDMRPGYGYPGLPDPFADEPTPEESGIWRVDLETGQAELIVSLAQVSRIPYSGELAEDAAAGKHWFNHLLFSPDGSRFIFLERWRTPGRRGFRTRMLTAAPDGSDVRVIDASGATSHFIWRDPAHILAWTRHPSHGDAFYLFEDQAGGAVEPVGLGVMTRNGHCSYLPGNEWILNDTYPDDQRLQHVYLYHVPSGKRVALGHFYSPPEYKGEWRCDTHPRFGPDGSKVVIDSPHGGNGRQMYLIDISAIVGKCESER